MLPAHHLNVTIAGRPAHARAIVVRGRVLLPFRAVFAGLGAQVSYDPQGRVVVARTSRTRLQMAIGARYAFVDGRRVALDVVPRIVGSQTYVPLRFVAQALGASVRYDAATHSVSIVPARLLTATRISFRLTPPDGGTSATAYPVVSATIVGAQAHAKDVHLTLDGTDVTPLASFDGSTITYIPRLPLQAGVHAVTFAGSTMARTPFNAHWAFSTLVQPANEPANPPLMDEFTFYADGSTFFRAGDWMHFVLIAPPGGSADLQLCTGFDYPLWNGGSSGVYQADAPAPLGYWIPSCIVTATYTSWSGTQSFIPDELTIALYTQREPYYNEPPTPTPQPTGTAAPRYIPPEPRHPEPTPAPMPVPSGRPLPTPNPVPLPHPMPHQHPVPLPTHPAWRVGPVRHPLPLPTHRPLPASTPRPRPASTARPHPHPRPHPVAHKPPTPKPAATKQP